MAVASGSAVPALLRTPCLTSPSDAWIGKLDRLGWPPASANAPRNAQISRSLCRSPRPDKRVCSSLGAAYSLPAIVDFPSSVEIPPNFAPNVKITEQRARRHWTSIGS